jgi:hypothetical protein
MASALAVATSPTAGSADRSSAPLTLGFVAASCCALAGLSVAAQATAADSCPGGITASVQVNVVMLHNMVSFPLPSELRPPSSDSRCRPSPTSPLTSCAGPPRTTRASRACAGPPSPRCRAVTSTRPAPRLPARRPLHSPRASLKCAWFSPSSPSLHAPPSDYMIDIFGFGSDSPHCLYSPGVNPLDRSRSKRFLRYRARTGPSRGTSARPFVPTLGGLA